MYKMLGILPNIMSNGNQTVIVKRGMSGLGLFANKNFKRGDFIIEYKGEHISHDESDRRGGRYLFTLNSKIVIDGKDRSNLARYINHGCDPNTEAESDYEDEKIRIYAKKKILKGDELTVDYGKDYWEDYIKPHGCKCEQCLSRKK